jgi:hypothetical protein
LRAPDWLIGFERAEGINRFGAIAANEEAVMTDAMEALGQNVDGEAADELVDVEKKTASTAFRGMRKRGHGQIRV